MIFSFKFEAYLYCISAQTGQAERDVTNIIWYSVGNVTHRPLEMLRPLHNVKKS